MRTYFHWDPSRTAKKRRRMLLLSAALCADISVAAFIVMFLNVCTAPDETVIVITLIIAAAAVFAGLLFCLVTAAVCDRRIRRRSRYTYLDISLKALVYSSYAGEYRVAGEKIIVRDVYCLPFAELASAGLEKGGKAVLLAGKLRHYCMNGDNLGYHVKNGDVEFDRPYLSIGGFTEEQKLRIPAVFGKAERVLASVNAAKKRFDELPAPKPYVFREADFIRLRPKARVLPESFDYSRKWQ